MNGPLLRTLERPALAVERHVNRLIGTTRLNPFYQTHTLALYLWVVVGVTGLILTLFFQFGFEASYASVAKMESQPLARVIRAMHKYSSGAAMIVTLLHAYRTFFMGRFRGPRWLAWVSGVAMTIFLWLGGVTGYWMIWDQRAQWITAAFVDLLDRVTPWSAHFAISLLEAEKTDRSWIFITWLLMAHIFLYIMAALLGWNHILRLQRPQLWPVRPWALGLSLVFFAVSAAFPAGLLPAADSSRLPDEMGLDLLYLFFLPANPSSAGWVWGLLAIAVAVACAVPWIGSRRNRPPDLHIEPDRCAGCTLCALDCPYHAITMARRQPKAGPKFLATIDAEMCVGCGICLGSCDSHAIALGDLNGDLLGDRIESRLAEGRRKGEASVLFTCERHASHGARRYLDPNRASDGPQIFVLPCVGALSSSAVARALDAGASEVRVIGCPPSDCAHREGNFWAEQRLTGHRLPRLPRRHAEARVVTSGQPPDAFSTTSSPEPFGRCRLPLLATFGLCALALAAQILLADLPFRPRPDATKEALVRVALPDPGRPYGPWVDEPLALPSQAHEVVLFLEADDRRLLTKRFLRERLLSAGLTPVFRELRLEPGKHDLRLGFHEDTPGAPGPLLLFDRTVKLDPGELVTLSSDQLIAEKKR